jgi:uncharacterized membrane protein
VTESAGPSDLERVAFFSDAVFAIAITLLVVELHVPDVASSGLWQALVDEWPSIGSFFLSFAVIGLYWMAHRGAYSHVVDLDSRLIVLNLVFLAFVAFQPFPTAVLGRYGSTGTAVAFYAATLTLTGAALAAGWAHAWRARLVSVGDERARSILYSSLGPPCVFAASIPVAVVSATAAKWCWLALVPVQRVLGRVRR